MEAALSRFFDRLEAYVLLGQGLDAYVEFAAVVPGIVLIDVVGSIRSGSLFSIGVHSNCGRSSSSSGRRVIIGRRLCQLDYRAFFTRSNSRVVMRLTRVDAMCNLETKASVLLGDVRIRWKPKFVSLLIFLAVDDRIVA